jgi:hypothetical protein
MKDAYPLGSTEEYQRLLKISFELLMKLTGRVLALERSLRVKGSSMRRWLSLQPTRFIFTANVSGEGGGTPINKAFVLRCMCGIRVCHLTRRASSMRCQYRFSNHDDGRCSYPSAAQYVWRKQYLIDDDHELSGTHHWRREVLL